MFSYQSTTRKYQYYDMDNIYILDEPNLCCMYQLDWPELVSVLCVNCNHFKLKIVNLSEIVKFIQMISMKLFSIEVWEESLMPVSNCEQMMRLHCANKKSMRYGGPCIIIKTIKSYRVSNNTKICSNQYEQMNMDKMCINPICILYNEK